MLVPPHHQVRDESRRGLSSCSVLLHPMGPPWSTGTSARGTCENSEPLSAVHHVPPPQLPPVWGLGGTEETTSSLLLVCVCVCVCVVVCVCVIVYVCV